MWDLQHNYALQSSPIINSLCSDDSGSAAPYFLPTDIPLDNDSRSPIRVKEAYPSAKRHVKPRVTPMRNLEDDQASQSTAVDHIPHSQGIQAQLTTMPQDNRASLAVLSTTKAQGSTDQSTLWNES